MSTKKYTIFLFPFAGGSDRSFVDLTTSLQRYAFLDCVPILYPGRGVLLGQGLYQKIEYLVNYIYEEVKNNLAKPYVFFGHSMGAMVSYLLVKKLRENQLDLPKHLFISGCSGPSCPRNISTSSLSSSAFWDFINELGGCPEELLEEEDLRDLFEPILRADFQCIEQYLHKEEEVLDVPIMVLLGRQDLISYPDAALWQRETSIPIQVRYFEGGHFFVFQNATEIADLICQTSIL